MPSKSFYQPIPSNEIPVLLTIFNRQNHTKEVINNLRKTKPKKLFIFADGPRLNIQNDDINCDLARKEILEIDWYCVIETQYLEKNIGCDPAVRMAINWFFDNVKHGIILEDDCLVSTQFFDFCGELLVKYSDDERIMQISSLSPYAVREYPYTYHFSGMFRCSGGWCTWRRAWDHFRSDMQEYTDKEGHSILKQYYPDYSKHKQIYKRFLDFKKGAYVS